MSIFRVLLLVLFYSVRTTLFTLVLEFPVRRVRFPEAHNSLLFIGRSVVLERGTGTGFFKVLER